MCQYDPHLGDKTILFSTAVTKIRPPLRTGSMSRIADKPIASTSHDNPHAGDTIIVFSTAGTPRVRAIA